MIPPSPSLPGSLSARLPQTNSQTLRNALTLPPELHELLPHALHPVCEARAYPRQAYVFRLGAVPQFMFFVLQGEVLLERTGVGGEPIVLQRTSRGFISEASLQSALYHCDARVANDAQVLCIPITALLAQLQQDPTFALRWIGMCNQEIRRLRLQCERRSIKTVQGRLIHLIETRGSHGQYSVGSDLKTVAAELGVTHEALYRTIATLEKAGRLRRENGKLMYV